MQTFNPKSGAGVGEITEDEKPLVITDSTGSEIELDLKNREGAYWVGWSTEQINLLIKALRTLGRGDLTPFECDLMLSESIRKGEAFSGGSGFATTYLMGKLRDHQLPPEEIAHLRKRKVKAIANKRGTPAEFPMPPGSGATYLMIPGKGSGPEQLEDGGFHVLDAYTEQFINPDKIKAAGLELVDYDPDNHMMNPPSHDRSKFTLGYDDPAEADGKQNIGSDKETLRIEQDEASRATPANIDGLKQALAEVSGN